MILSLIPEITNPFKYMKKNKHLNTLEMIKFHAFLKLLWYSKSFLW